MERFGVSHLIIGMIALVAGLFFGVQLAKPQVAQLEQQIAVLTKEVQGWEDWYEWWSSGPVEVDASSSSDFDYEEYKHRVEEITDQMIERGEELNEWYKEMAEKDREMLDRMREQRMERDLREIRQSLETLERKAIFD